MAEQAIEPSLAQGDLDAGVGEDWLGAWMTRFGDLKTVTRISARCWGRVKCSRKNESSIVGQASRLSMRQRTPVPQ